MRELASKWAAEEEAADMLHARLAVLLVSGLWLDTQAVAQFGISGPYSHESLSVFLIHRSAPTWTDGGIKPSTVHNLTLEQALNQKKVLVHETNRVNELAVENISDEAIFIQAGDIVKGGNQDRMITNDFILSPHSGKLPIAAFCVEQGRWGQRGNEPVLQFSIPAQSGIRPLFGARWRSSRKRSRLIFAIRRVRLGWPGFGRRLLRAVCCSRRPARRSRKRSALTPKNLPVSPRHRRT